MNAIEAAGLDAAEENARSRAEFGKCRTEIEKARLDHSAYTTDATVADMEVLRRAFDISRWNLASISYGSLVTLHAMRRTPGFIRSVILNSPYPPNSVTWAEQASTAAAAYTAIDRECTSQPACRKRFGAIIPKLEATLARIEKTPLKDGDRLITGRQFASALWPMAVRSSSVRFVPLAINRAHSGDTAMIKKMVAMFAGSDSFGGFSPAQAYAISCHESGHTTAWYRRARALYPALVPAAPDDAWDVCAQPTAPASRTLLLRPGRQQHSQLDLRRLPRRRHRSSTPTRRCVLPRATLVEVQGTAHGTMAVDECTLGIAAAFLANPAAPPDTACISKRAPIDFATKGLDELLTPVGS